MYFIFNTFSHRKQFINETKIEMFMWILNWLSHWALAKWFSNAFLICYYLDISLSRTDLQSTMHDIHNDGQLPVKFENETNKKNYFNEEYISLVSKDWQLNRYDFISNSLLYFAKKEIIGKKNVENDV